MGIGIAAGAALSVLLNYKRKYQNQNDERMSNENDILENANDFLLNARNKADELVNDARTKSGLMIEEAGKLLSTIKSKTSEMHEKISLGAGDEAQRIRNELQILISEFREKLN